MLVFELLLSLPLECKLLEGKKFVFCFFPLLRHRALNSAMHKVGAW